MPDLLSCPYCGGDAVQGQTDEGIVVCCQEAACPLRPATVPCDTAAEAVSAWNATPGSSRQRPEAKAAPGVRECPFCGSAPNVSTAGGEASVECGNPGCHVASEIAVRYGANADGRYTYPDRDLALRMAVERWNTRV